MKHSSCVILAIFLILPVSSSEVTKSITNQNTSLQIKDEIAFSIKEEQNWGCWDASWFYNRDPIVINNDYKYYAEKHGIDLKTLQGYNFRPRKFWEQPISTIIQVLFPAIKQNKVIDIITFCMGTDEEDCFASHSNGSSFKENVPRTLPGIMEYFFEQDTFNAINKWMISEGSEPIKPDDYWDSLHGYYMEATESIAKNTTRETRTYPLFEYFIPYFW